jgi:SAM-dependent methyltransferase
MIRSARAKAILKQIGRSLALVKPILEPLAQVEATLAARWARGAHARLMMVQWGLPPQPEHFDHYEDLYYVWLSERNPLWLERGVYGTLALKGGDVLELACGDGFNARNFYSIRSKHVLACDFDPKAIRTAQHKNSAPNVNFLLADIRTAMPPGKFDNVIWDAAIEHFTPQETEQILRNIKTRLIGGGVLSGYTIVEQTDGTKSLSHHEYEFKGKEDLYRILTPHFRQVTVFETIYPKRHNLYFWASDDAIPFSPEWRDFVTSVHEALPSRQRDGV